MEGIHVVYTIELHMAHRFIDSSLIVEHIDNDSLIFVESHP